MNIVDYISTQNNEYLKLIKRGEKKAKDLDDELDALCYELEEAEQKYNVKRRETAVAYDTRISRLEAMFDKDKKDVDVKVNAIKNELDSQKKKHIDDVNSRLKKIDDDHKDEIGRIKAQYSEKILKLEEEFELRIAGLDHSKKIFEEQQIAEKDRKSQELISAVQKKENERAILKSKIDNCIAEYTDKFITAVYNGRSCEDIKEKYTIISYAEQYYDVCNQISDFQKNANILSNKNIVVGNVDDSDVKYWRDIYLDEKQSLESLRDRKLKKAEAKYLEEKAELERNLGDVSGYDIKKNRDITDFYNDIEQKKNALPLEIEKINKEKEQALENLKAEFQKSVKKINRSIETLKQEKEDLEYSFESKITTLLEETKAKVQELLSGSAGYHIEKKDLTGIKDLPEKICIGGYTTEIEPCEITKKLFGGRLAGFDAPVMLPMRWLEDKSKSEERKNGNVIITCKNSDVDDDELNSIVMGLTLKYLQEFPAGTLKVHLIDETSNVIFERFKNAFSDTKYEHLVDCKDLVSTYSLEDNAFEKTNCLCEEVQLRLAGQIRDLYDLYRQDKTYQFQLFVIRRGLSRVLGGKTKEFKNLIAQMGRNCGVRFIIVDDINDNNRMYVNNDILNDFRELGVNLKYDSKRVYLGNMEIGVSMLPERTDHRIFVEDVARDIADAMISNVSEYVTYSDIGFDSYPEDVDTDLIDIPVGMYGKEVFSIPFNCTGQGGKNNQGLIVIGKQRRGKSSLYNSLILNGCMKYSPDDLQFWLLDFKGGMTSSNYFNSGIPHIKLLSLKNSVHDAIPFFEMLRSEMNQRYQQFINSGSKYRGTTFTNLVEYNKYIDKEPSKEYCHMSRIIVVIDEAQFMFAKDNKEGFGSSQAQQIGEYIKDIVERGAAAGIHLIIIAQSLSDNAAILIDNFVKKVEARISFNIDSDLLRSAKLFEANSDRVCNQIESLRTGVTFSTYSGKNSMPERVKMAFCNEAQLKDYFGKIHNKYKQYKCETRVVGNISQLNPTDINSVYGMNYASLLKTHTVEKTRNQVTYKLPIGEDFFMKKAEIPFESYENSMLVAIGNNQTMLSSIGTDLLKCVDAFEQKKILVCNCDNRDYIFKKALADMESKNDVSLYSDEDISTMILEVYKEFKLRQKRANAGDMDNIPMFVFINKLNFISYIEMIDIKSGMNKVSRVSGIYKAPKPNAGTYDINDDDSDDCIDPDDFNMLADNLTENDAYSSNYDLLTRTQQKVEADINSGSLDNTDENEEIFRNISGMKMVEVLCEMCEISSRNEIFFIITASQLCPSINDKVFVNSKNKLLFNDLPEDISLGRNGYEVKEMLSNLKTENNGEGSKNIAIMSLNNVITKIRPVIWDID